MRVLAGPSKLQLLLVADFAGLLLAPLNTLPCAPIDAGGEGLPGLKGATGPQGETGADGPQGTTGGPGTQGENGWAFARSTGRSSTCWARGGGCLESVRGAGDA